MIRRRVRGRIIDLLGQVPAVAVLGPRKCGKTAMVRDLAAFRPSVYVDLGNPGEIEKVSQAEQFFPLHEDKLVVIDDAWRAPDLMADLRRQIDYGRRRGHRTGRFILIGPASGALERRIGAALEDGVVTCMLDPLDALEIPEGAESQLRHWNRGGYPESYEASAAPVSQRWREFHIRDTLEHDLAIFGPRAPAQVLRRFWTMLANGQGGPLNAQRLAQGLGISGVTVGRYLGQLVDLRLVRRLPPFEAATGKRMVKLPRIYVRDSGIVHALLGLQRLEDVLGHPVAGPSWEGYVIENVLAVIPPETRFGFYRTAAGAEIDLVLDIPGRGRWAIDVTRDPQARPTRGFTQACDDLKPESRYLVTPSAESRRARPGVVAIGLRELVERIAAPHQ